MLQTTIRETITCSGIGLHSGKMVRLTLKPAPADTGIRFDIYGRKKLSHLRATPRAVTATSLATTLSCDNARVATVEHLLAAIRGLGIDNIIVEAEGGEVPIMDGSAAPFVLLFNDTGIVRQNAPRRVARISRELTVRNGTKSITALPYAGFKVEYTIDFPHPLIGVQRMTLDLTPVRFAEVARARTFGFLKEVEYMRSKGLALGGSLDNAIVLAEYAVLNSDGLRFPDEFVRHKVLDFIGDAAMFGPVLEGHFIVNCSGHALNNEFLRVLEDSADIYLEAFTYPMPLRKPVATRAPACAGSLAPAQS
jgi:UDP-3-O-[3-hydroxymyristoyl] N-acetylglucosamine deacetylase